MQRILVMIRYLLHSLFTSLAGLLYVLVAVVFWLLFFDPRQGTPEAEYYVLVIGAFGVAVSFLLTLSIASRANRAVNYPLLVRLPSRVEYLTAVFVSALIAAVLLQLLVAALALFRGPALMPGQALELPPIWLAPNILAAALALHASDFVAAGWSRVYVFGVLALFLFGQGIDNTFLSGFVASLNRFFLEQGWFEVSNALSDFSNGMSNSDTNVLSRILGFIFWPFRAIVEASVNGYFTPTQALAPAILLLYATILFMLAADLFANKDIEFTE
jgi:hypothetical protein